MVMLHTLVDCQSMTLHLKLQSFLMPLQSSSRYSDTLCIGLHMLHNSALPPASAPLHMLLLLVCLFVSPSGLFPLIDGQWTSAKSNCTHSIRRGLGRRLRSSLLLNSSPSTSRDHPLVTKQRSTRAHPFAHALTAEEDFKTSHPPHSHPPPPWQHSKNRSHYSHSRSRHCRTN